jgi:predicted exporter
MLVCLGILAWRLPRVPVETSVFALVPADASDKGLAEASKDLREDAQKRLAFLVGHSDPVQAGVAADELAAALQGVSALAGVRSQVPDTAAAALLRFYAPHQALLLAPEDQARLEAGSGALADAALRTLYLPPGMSGSLGFERDPFGQAGRWLAARAGAAGKLQFRDGRLWADGDSQHWVLVSAELKIRPASLGQADALEAQLNAARGRALSHSGVSVLRTGFAFHELSAARRAQIEASSIGTASVIALLAMLWAAFRGWRSIGLIYVPVGAGCLLATAGVLAAGGPLHLMTLVFGSTLVGSGEDYGLHLLSGLYESRPWDPDRRLRAVWRSLWLALVTSLLGYCVLFLVPIAAIKQVALFSCLGLIGAWLTTVWLFPWATRSLPLAGQRARSGMAKAVALWPRLTRQRLWILLPVLVVLAWSWSRLRTDDDVRLLYAQDPVLKAEQERAEPLLGFPSDGRFFALTGKDAEARLQAEEALRARLAALDPTAPLALGVSLFVPSEAAQARARVAWERSLPAAALKLQAQLGEPGLAQRLRTQIRRQSQPLRVADWLADPVSTPFRRLWRDGEGAVSVVLVPAGIHLDVAALQSAAAQVPGARLIDPVGRVSSQLGGLRLRLSWVLALGGLGIIAALYGTLGARATGALAPTLLGVGFGLAGLAWADLPLNLFAVLAVALIMGVGVDYGVFVQESRDGAAPAALLTISVGAGSNLAAFGLLAFSSTPALRVIGLVLSLGLGAAWLTAFSFSQPSRSTDHA